MGGGGEQGAASHSGNEDGRLGQAGMGWGKGGWDLGSSEGHGFGGGLYPFATLGGLQARCGRWKMPTAHGALLGPLCSGVPSPPQSPRALPGIGGQPGDRAGCGGEVGKGGGHLASLKCPQDRAWPPPQRAGERWRRLRRGGGRACRAGTRGMHKSPSVRACVRRAGPARRPSLPRRGQERSGGAMGRGAGLSLGLSRLPRWVWGLP